jgi:hypothetical protein
LQSAHFARSGLASAQQLHRYGGLERRREASACKRPRAAMRIQPARREEAFAHPGCAAGMIHAERQYAKGDFMKGNLVIVCRDSDAEAFDAIMAEYGAFQIRLSSTAWYLKLDVSPELIQAEILDRLGKFTTHYIFEAGAVTFNTVDSDAASALNSLFTI